jgi:hypothetical protein
VLAFALVLAFLLLRSPHGWGDDFAGYLLQARSLVEGNPSAEVALNGELLRIADWRSGPDAYPWGLPLLMAAAHPLTGWNVSALNGIGVLAFVLTGLATAALARRFGLYALGVVVAVALTVWQRYLLGGVGGLASDVPFLAFSLGALLTVDSLMTSGGRSGAGFGLVLLAVLLSVASFAVRSNGAIVIGTVGFALLINVMTDSETRGRAITELVAFVVLTAAGVLAYFKGLPDGSLVHVSYLSLEPASIIGRIHGHIEALGLLFPIDVLPHVLRPVGILGLAVLCLGGAWVLGARGLVLLAYLGGHLLLLTAFKFEGGMRYYFPLIPVIAILAVRGAAFYYEAFLGSTWGRALRGKPVAEFAAAGLLLLVAALAIHFTRRDMKPDPSGPYTEATAQMVTEVQNRFPPEARVSFFKPRALRWLTGRNGVLIREPDHLDVVDGVVLHPMVGEEFQMTQAKVEASGAFDLAWSNDQFLLYTRKLNQPRPTRP